MTTPLIPISTLESIYDSITKPSAARKDSFNKSCDDIIKTLQEFKKPDNLFISREDFIKQYAKIPKIGADSSLSFITGKGKQQQVESGSIFRKYYDLAKLMEKFGYKDKIADLDFKPHVD